MKISLIHNLLDGTILIVEQALNLQRTQMGDIVRGYTVVIAQIPLTLILDNRVVGGPTYDGVEDDALIAERSVGIVTDGVAEEVAVAGRVREIVLAIVFVHPRSLEETVGVACLHGFTVLVENHDSTGSLGKLLDVVAHADNGAIDGRTVGSGEELAFVVGSSTKVDETILFAILSEDGS